ncbi:MAG: mandelate racemase/muconate lactonizing enzyme family protein [Thaumarchaeota archaeon]|nr:mandelate racemase/muconate lactonizing enzyme family protein [Nitrososphaerota archaeon]
MKIDSIQTYLIDNPWKKWLFVRVGTSDGSYGLAEGTLYGESSAVISELQDRRNMYMGKDPFMIEKLWNDWYRDSFNRNASAPNITALSAVETACWDIVGKHYGAPIHALLGGAIRDKVKVYANGWYTHVSTPEEFAERAKEVVKKGYRAIKFDPFGTSYLSASTEDIRSYVRIIGAVREAVGDDTELLIEGHGRFTAETAVRIAKQIEGYNPRWFEEPVPPEDLEALRTVAAKTTIPIASGERVLTIYGFAPLIESHSVDIIQPDLINAGGILQGKKISALADAHYVMVAPHQAEGPLATATCLQLDACIQNFEIQESFDEFDIAWRQDLLKEPIKIEGGYMSIPHGPGLGVELRMKEVEKHLATTAERPDFNLFERGWENRNLPKPVGHRNGPQTRSRANLTTSRPTRRKLE